MNINFKNKKILLTLILFLVIGFAAVTTTLVLNGAVNLAFNKDDFNVIFSKASVDGDSGLTEISEDGKTLTFKTTVLSEIGQESVLRYTVSNLSKNYDADVEFNTNIEASDLVDIEYKPASMDIKSGAEKNGTIIVRLKNVVEVDQEILVHFSYSARPKSFAKANSSVDLKIPNMIRPFSEYDADIEITDEMLAAVGMTREDWDFILNMTDEQLAEENLTREEYNKIVEENKKYILERSSALNLSFFWTYREDITRVVFQNEKVEPGDYSYKFDVSVAEDESVVAYLVNNSSTGLTLYIQANGNIIANPDSSMMFYAFNDLVEITGLEYLDTSLVTNMHGMFWFDPQDEYNKDKNTTLKSLDVSNFDTNNVTDMSYMFSGITALESLDLSSFITKNVTNMSGMFDDCSSLTQLDVSYFDTSNVTNMYSMFSGCSNLTQLDLTNFNTNQVTSMSSMFSYCSKLTQLDVSHFNTSQVTSMSYMFAYCSNLTQLDLSNFDTGQVTNMYSMFENCSSLKNMNIMSFETSKVKDMSWMFKGCSGIVEIDLSNFDTSNVTDMGWMFEGCTSLKSLDLESFNTVGVTDMAYMFDDCSSLILLNIQNFNFSNVTKPANIFSSMPKDASVTVKDKASQDWILALNSTYRPSSWTTSSVVIAS